MSNSSNGRKPSGESSSKQSEHTPPWWYSGSHCLAALFWVFTLSVAWYGLLSDSGMAWPVAILGLALAVLQSSMAMVKGKVR